MRKLFWAVASAALLVAATLTFAAPASAATQWSEQDSGSTADLNGVAFVSDTTGMAVGADGTVLATDDGGATWTPVDAGTTVDLHAVMGVGEFCPSSADCWWVAGANGTILFSDDSGATWCSQQTNTTEAITDLANVGPNDVLASGTNGVVLRSEGGSNGRMCGEDANYLVAPTGTTDDLHGITNNPGGGGWTAVGDDGTIVRSTDFAEGAPVDSPTDTDLFAITGNCGDVCREIGVGAGGTVVASVDGGAFTDHSAGVPGDLRSVVMPLDEESGRAVGDSGTVVSTSDGGETWTTESTPTCAHLMSVSQPVVVEGMTPTADDAWAVGAAGTVITNAEDSDATEPDCEGPGPGYRMVAGDGGIFTFGEDRNFHGSTGDLVLNQPIVGGATRQNDFDGYWIVAGDGGVFAFNAEFHGSLANEVLPAPAVDIEPTPTGKGYWIVLEDGTVRPFGDAKHHGDMAGLTLNQPVIGMSVTVSGEGYWLVAEDGGIFSFGDAVFHGSMGGQRLNAPVIDLGPTTDGDGYYLLGADGGVFSFGSAVFHGSTGAMRLNAPVVSMLVRPSGYWFAAADGGVFTFGGLPFLGSMGAVRLNSPVLDMID